MHQEKERVRGEPLTAQRRVVVDTDLSRVSELLRHADEPERLLSRIAEEVAHRLACDAVGILAVGTHKAAMLEGFALPHGLRAWRGDGEGVDDALARRLLWAAKGAYRDVHLFPITQGAEDLGAIAVFAKKENELDGGERRFVEALGRVAAVAFELERLGSCLTRARERAKVARAALDRAEPLRLLGEMTVGVAHDLRNILNPMSLHLHLCSSLLRDDQIEARETLAEMTRVLRRGAGLLTRLRSFGSDGGEGLELVDNPAALVTEAVRIARPRTCAGAGERLVEVRAEVSPLPPIRANAAELVSAVVNLILNAMDAMPTGGTVKVSTARDGAWALVSVSDDGPGVPRELRERIFEPFFTTKKGKGTGLGLAMVKGFVERCGGRVSLRTGASAGATFTMRFPLG